MPRVVIVGAGFGGLNAAQALAGKPVDVMLVDRYNYHLFQPLLYQVATAGLEPEEIAYPVRRIVRKAANVGFRMAMVEGVDLEGRKLRTDDGDIPYDYLVLAGGSDNNFFGNASLEKHALGLKDLQQAVELRNHILSCFERAVALPAGAERDALLTFVVGGGGPTGVEFAGALSELVHLVLTHDFRDTVSRDEVRIILVEGGPDLLGTFRPGSRKDAIHELVCKNIEVRVNLHIKEYDGKLVTLGDGSTIRAGTLMWAAGVRAAHLAEAVGVKLAHGSRLPVTPTLQLEGHPEVYVAGDMAYLEERAKPLPQLAPVAIQQGRIAAENILRATLDIPPRRFHYRDKGTLATIGRNAAVAEFGPIRLSGFLAWVTWLAVHIVMLIGFRNRVVVLIDWAWNYFSYDRALRLITRRGP